MLASFMAQLGKSVLVLEQHDQAVLCLSQFGPHAQTPLGAISDRDFLVDRKDGATLEGGCGAGAEDDAGGDEC